MTKLFVGLLGYLVGCLALVGAPAAALMLLLPSIDSAISATDARQHELPPKLANFVERKREDAARDQAMREEALRLAEARKAAAASAAVVKASAPLAIMAKTETPPKAEKRSLAKPTAKKPKTQVARTPQSLPTEIRPQPDVQYALGYAEQPALRSTGLYPWER
jgi:hypothetical protein